ncbi:hypothetical protein NXF25_018966 [Crotalus adamanteus]|uniref:Uncharacterized protein n=1 Tax=Crotalus adamanteus TaxID=8729 RepID=A0AAW1B1B2_CROAD
MIRFQNYGRLC